MDLAQLQERLKGLLRDVDPADQASVAARLSEFFQFAVDNYETLDSDARGYVDHAFETLRQTVRRTVEASPDGAAKRQAERQLAIAEGQHFEAEPLLRILEASPSVDDPVLPAARATFAELLQRVLDVMYDVTRHTHKGPASFAKVGLFYWAVDELLVAMHLAQRAFTNQAYTHIRTVYEILDKIELFHKNPEYAQLWVSGPDKKVRKELRPSAVRGRLGKPKFDPVYSFFSELGPHGTFKGLQARGARTNSPSEEGRPRFRLWVGGSPLRHHVVWTNSACVDAALTTLVKCVKVFAQYLNEEEMRHVLDSSLELQNRFVREHYVKWVESVGLDPKPLVDLLDKRPWKRLAGLE
jgi:hypothetical protein